MLINNYFHRNMYTLYDCKQNVFTLLLLFKKYTNQNFTVPIELNRYDVCIVSSELYVKRIENWRSNCLFKIFVYFEK